MRYLQAPGHGATAYIKAPCHADNRGESCRLPWRGNASAAAYRRTLDRSQRDRRLLVGTGLPLLQCVGKLMARCMSCGTTRRVQGFGNSRPGNELSAHEYRLGPAWVEVWCTPARPLRCIDTRANRRRFHESRSDSSGSSISDWAILAASAAALRSFSLPSSTSSSRFK